MKIIALIARLLMGVIYVLYGLNYFVHFIHATLPPGKAGEFEGALMTSGYFFQYMKTMQLIGGILLLMNRYTQLVIVILFPISVNIFLFHVFLAPKGLITAIVLLVTNILLLVAHRSKYSPLFMAVDAGPYSGKKINF